MSGGAPTKKTSKDVARRAALIADVHAYGGAALVSAGVGFWNISAGVVVFGGFLMYVGLFWGRSKP